MLACGVEDWACCGAIVLFCAVVVAGMSEAVVAPCGTAVPDWVLLAATSDGDGVGETGSGITAACCCGWTLDWLVSAAMRAEAALPVLLL